MATWKQVHEHQIESQCSDREQFLDDCLIVFDTNILLNLYEVKNSQRDDFFAIANDDKIQSRLFLPHEVISEFNRNRAFLLERRISEISELHHLVSKAKKLANGVSAPAGELVNELDRVEKATRKFLAEVKRNNTLEGDVIFQDLLDLFNDENHTDDDNVRKDNLRVAKSLLAAHDAPGWADLRKRDGGAGDGIIWVEMLNVARKRNKNILIVTNDSKEDWCIQAGAKGNILLPQLRESFHESTGKEIRYMNWLQFKKAAQAFASLVLDISDDDGTEDENESVTRRLYPTAKDYIDGVQKKYISDMMSQTIVDAKLHNTIDMDKLFPKINWVPEISLGPVVPNMFQGLNSELELLLNAASHHQFDDYSQDADEVYEADGGKEEDGASGEPIRPSDE